MSSPGSSTTRPDIGLLNPAWSTISIPNIKKPRALAVVAKFPGNDAASRRPQKGSRVPRRAQDLLRAAEPAGDALRSMSCCAAGPVLFGSGAPIAQPRARRCCGCFAGGTRVRAGVLGRRVEGTVLAHDVFQGNGRC